MVVSNGLKDIGPWLSKLVRFNHFPIFLGVNVFKINWNRHLAKQLPSSKTLGWTNHQNVPTHGPLWQNPEVTRTSMHYSMQNPSECTDIGVQYLQGKHCFYFILRGPIFHVRTTNHQTVLQLIPARSPQTHFIWTETRCGGRRVPLVVMMIHDDIW